MRAVVLAAGWASRLGALSDAGPKALLPVGERMPLDFVVAALDAVQAVERIDIVTHDGHRPRLAAWAGDRAPRAALRVLSNGTRRPEQRLGAVGDLHRFLATEKPDGPLLVLGGDMVFDGSLEALASGPPDELAIAVHDVGSAERVRQLASVALDSGGRVRRFVEKDPEPPSHLAAPAMYRLPPGALAEVDAYLGEGGSTDGLGHLVAWWVERRVVRGVPLPGRWIDIGTPEEYARAQREFGAPTG